MELPEILTVRQVAELLQMNPVVINRFAASGLNGFPRGRKIGAGKNNAPRRWLRDDIFEWLRSGRDLDEPRQPSPPRDPNAPKRRVGRPRKNEISQLNPAN